MGNFPVPEFAQKFPVFKNSMSLTKKEPEEEVWSLWDGDKSWKVGKLSLEEQKKYPMKKLCDVKALARNIETGKRQYYTKADSITDNPKNHYISF